MFKEIYGELINGNLKAHVHGHIRNYLWTYKEKIQSLNCIKEMKPMRPLIDVVLINKYKPDKE